MSTDALVERLGWTLLHSIWQLALIALLFAGAYRLLARRSPQARYVLSGLTLLAMLAGPVATYTWLAARPAQNQIALSYEPAATESPTTAFLEEQTEWLGEPSFVVVPEPPGPSPLDWPGSRDLETVAAPANPARVEQAPQIETAEATVPLADTVWHTHMRTAVEPTFPVLVGLWLAGVLLLSCRHLGGWYVVERLRRRGTVPVAPWLAALAGQLSRRLGLRRTVQLLESAAVTVPSVVGWFRPVILLPLGLASGLPADQLEAILLHELAHIRRRDYLANLLQTAAETLLFYHPAVWWVSNRMRLEREYCADELAANACGNRLAYAQALVTLEEQCARPAGLAVAANGSDLRRRIERVLGIRREPTGQTGQWVAGVIAALLLIATAAMAPWGRANAEAGDQPAVADRVSEQASTNRDDEPARAKMRAESREWAQRHLPEQPWAHDAKFQFSTPEVFVYAQECETIEADGAVRLRPFAMIWREGLRKAPMMVVSDSAHVKFAGEWDKSNVKLQSIVAARFDGNVRIKGDNGFRVEGRDFDYAKDGLRLASDKPLKMAYGASIGVADSVSIELSPNPGSQAVGPPVLSGDLRFELLQFTGRSRKVPEAGFSASKLIFNRRIEDILAAPTKDAKPSSQSSQEGTHRLESDEDVVKAAAAEESQEPIVQGRFWQASVWVPKKAAAEESQEPVVQAAASEDEPAERVNPLAAFGGALLMLAERVVEDVTAPPTAHEFFARVVTEAGQPVTNAVVMPHGLGLSGGSSVGWKNFEEFVPPTKTNAEGLFRLDLSKVFDSPDSPLQSSHFKGRRRVTRVSLIVEHPDHPPWKNSLWVGETAGAARPIHANADGSPEQKIVLSDSQTIEIRARRAGESGLLDNLYPVITGGDFPDWSQADGVLTVRRVDLTRNQQPARWLRVVHAPDDGPAWFSDLIDLKQYEDEPISIDVELKPSVRVAGKLSEQVPRPVKNGRVVAAVTTGPDTSNTWSWNAVAEIAADGSFVLDSLPADENLQIVAVCDGWVSVSPTPTEVQHYSTEHGFALRGDPGYYDYATLYRHAQAARLAEGVVFPRLHRLEGRRTEVTIPMEETAACEVTVVDAEDRPIPEANVTFVPNHLWFNGGSYTLGQSHDTLSYVRRKLAMDADPKAPPESFGDNPYAVKTNAEGVAVVPNLPPRPGRPTSEQEYPFGVAHPDYIPQYGYASWPGRPSVKLIPGQTGRVTVRLQRQ